MDPYREISFFGDDDGGRLFHPYGERSRFGRATLTTCGLVLDRPDWIGTPDDAAEQAVWWLGASSLGTSTLTQTVKEESPNGKKFDESGAVFIRAGAFWLQMDCGPFGFGGAGHSHSDSLSLILRHAGKTVFLDPGTFTYISDLEQRNWFRGSAAHSTVRVGSQDQAEPVNPFRWAGKPNVVLSRLKETADGWWVDAFCEYRGLHHRRQILLNSERLLVLDQVSASDGRASMQLCEQTWQLGPGAGDLFLSTSAPAVKKESWYSPAYGCKLPGECLVASLEGDLPLSLAMELSVQRREPVTLPKACAAFESLAGSLVF